MSKCAIITDSDPEEDKDKSDRAQKAKDLEGQNLKVCLAPHTLEYDLFEQSEHNKSIMRDVYRKMHAQTNDLRGDFNASTLPQIRNYALNMIQKRKESASLVKRGHSASNVTIKTYKCPLPHYAT